MTGFNRLRWRLSGAAISLFPPKNFLCEVGKERRGRKTAGALQLRAQLAVAVGGQTVKRRQHPESFPAAANRNKHRQQRRSRSGRNLTAPNPAPGRNLHIAACQKRNAPRRVFSPQQRMAANRQSEKKHHRRRRDNPQRGGSGYNPCNSIDGDRARRRQQRGERRRPGKRKFNFHNNER